MAINSKQFLGLVALVAASAAGGALLMQAGSKAVADSGHGKHDSAGKSPGAVLAAVPAKPGKPIKRASWTCPMHPQIVQDHPGNCPICGMNLVEVKASQGEGAEMAMPAAAAPASIQVDAATQQRMGVRLAGVAAVALRQRLDAVATVTADASRSVIVAPKAEGWVKRLYVSVPGQAVRKGQVLYEIYSPDLQQRQRDYLDLLTRRDSLNAGSMDVMAYNAMTGSIARERFRQRDRLLAADLPPALLDKLDTGRKVIDVVPVRAERDGVVTEINVREGSFVNPAQPILSYADTSLLWVELNIFPDQLAALGKGALVLSDGAHPEWSARLDTRQAITQVDGESRLAKVRLPLSRAPGWLKLGATLTGGLEASEAPVLAVPSDALIRTGQGDYVVLAGEAEHFSLQPIKLGRSDGTHSQVLSGLAAGQKIAVNGQFLLGAEASINASRQRMQSHIASAQAEAAMPAMPAMGHDHMMQH